ncbi:MAG: hypothetical protein KatS3mg010_1904 [Acidimicrobiia bacterium]|nr:MAG: hypothetical protein KatS3mg010_1904 [Acidimicrobiia bacterium]
MRLADVSSDMESDPTRWPFAASTSPGASPSRARRASSRSTHSSVSCTRSGAGAHVDGEEAGVVVRGPVRVHGVREATLLPDLLEEARRHPPAERLVQHDQRVPVGVEGGEGAHAHHDVVLLGVARHHGDGNRRCGRRVLAFGTVAVPRREPGLAQRDDALVREVPGRREHDVRRPVVRPVVPDDRVAGHRRDALVRTDHLSPERVVREERTVEHVVHEVVGRVVAHGDLLEDHLALRLDLVGAQRRAPQHVGEDVERELQVLVGDAHVEHRVLVRGEGVHLAADGLDGRRELPSAAFLGALEQQVLEEVARAPLAGALVAPAAADPGADGHRPQVRQRLGDDAQAGAKARPADRLVHREEPVRLRRPRRPARRDRGRLPAGDRRAGDRAPRRSPPPTGAGGGSSAGPRSPNSSRA